MLNYYALQALSLIAREKSFAKAARTLHITQPAISQRIRLLEDQLGEQLITRAHPPRLSAVGSQLVQHFEQVQQLEHELGLSQEDTGLANQTPTITIGVNADSLGTWLIPVLSPWARTQRMRIEFLVEDEDYSFELIRQGQVAGAISSRERALHGCNVERLGKLEYACVASPSYQQQHWKGKSSAKARLMQLATLPCIAFGRKDDMQENFLRQHLGLMNPQLQPHYIASNQAYLEAICHGWGWGLVPRIQAQPLLKARKLVELCTGYELGVALYWHQWRQSSTLGKELAQLLVKGARKVLGGTGV